MPRLISSFFCIQGRAFQFRALAFGPKTSPRVFTKIMAVAAAHLRMQSIKLAVYLDDWLSQNARRRFLLKNREAIFSLLSQLGFLINKEKIKFGTYPRYNIHRREVLLRQGHYHAYSRENCEIKKCNYSSAGRKSDSKAVLTNTA